MDQDDGSDQDEILKVTKDDPKADEDDEEGEEYDEEAEEDVYAATNASYWNKANKESNCVADTSSRISKPICLTKALVYPSHMPGRSRGAN
jgi:hypothetical protein